MQIDKVNVYQVLLPFSGDFSISRLKGLSSIIIVIEVISDHGEIKGYGEGLPVEFITGETPASVIKDIKLFTHNNLFPWNLNDVSQIWDFADCFPNGKEHNAAICALEMSLLDALAKRQDKSIIEYFPKELCTNSIFYGATIPLAEKQRIMELCKMIRKMRINKLRVKMGKEFKQNVI
jgi:L-alanine-DL-glutamate epimerase-like enolase superfamily enzyme